MHAPAEASPTQGALQGQLCHPQREGMRREGREGRKAQAGRRVSAWAAGDAPLARSLVAALRFVGLGGVRKVVEFIVSLIASSCDGKADHSRLPGLRRA